MKDFCTLVLGTLIWITGLFWLAVICAALVILAIPTFPIAAIVVAVSYYLKKGSRE